MRYAVVIVAFVILAGTFHIMFTIFDYLYYDPDTGILTQMTSILNESLDASHQANAWENYQMLYQAFGIGRFVWFGMAIFCTAASIVMSRQESE